jgi:hypothetical protein
VLVRVAGAAARHRCYATLVVLRDVATLLQHCGSNLILLFFTQELQEKKKARKRKRSEIQNMFLGSIG